MPLSKEQKDELRATLTANEGTRASQAWKGVDLENAEDHELLAFNELLTLLAPIEDGVSCPCGRKAVYNETRHRWEHQGNPTKNALPKTVGEFIANGGGTTKEREVFNLMEKDYDRMHLEAFDALTANASDELRQHLWEKEGYKDKSLQELQTLLQLLPKQTQQVPEPTANYFGRQGAPSIAPPVLNEQPLLSPVLEFKKREVG